MAECRKELEKLAQEKLAEASKLLHEAGELADKGGFSLSFWGGGDYTPSFEEVTPELCACALERLVSEDYGDQAYSQIEIDALSQEERENLISEAVKEIIEENLHEYQKPGEWWMPSMC